MPLGVKIFYSLTGFPAVEKLVIARFTLDNNYPAGGYAVTPDMFGLVGFAGQPTGISGLIFPFVLSGPGQGGFGFLMDVDLATGKLRVYYPTGGASAAPGAVADPVASGAPPVGAVAVTSTGAQPVIASALTPGRGKEVAAATDLSALTAVLLAVGH